MSENVRLDGFDRNTSLPSASGITSSVGTGGQGDAGNVTVTANSLEIVNGATPEASGFGRGNAGNIILNINEAISVEGFNTQDGRSSSLGSTIAPTGEGNSGSLEITANRMDVLGGAQVSAVTFGRGNSGDVMIDVNDALLVEGRNPLINFPSLIFVGLQLGSVGNSGDLTVTANTLTIDGTQIGSGTFGQGTAGNISLDVVDTVQLSNGGLLFTSVESAAQGSAGELTIETNTLDVTAGSQILAVSFGTGDSGNIDIEAENVTLEGSNPLNNDPSAISTSLQANSTGIGGNVEISADELRVLNDAQIGSATLGTGDSGDVILDITGTVIVDGFDSLDNSPSLITSSVQPEGEGDGGDILLNANSLAVTNGGQISSGTNGEGNAGNVVVNVQETVRLAGENPSSEFQGGISSNARAGAVGDGGLIQLTTNNLEILEGSVISAFSESTGIAGSLLLSVREQLLVSNGGINTFAQQNSGGDITINAGAVVLQLDSDIETAVRQGEGQGGDISVVARSVAAFDDSDILADASQGQGGDIVFDTPAFFGEGYRPSSEQVSPDELDGNNRVDISASGAIAGSITLPDVSFIQDELTELPDNIVNTNQLIASSCIARRGDSGSFVVAGGGGLPDRPGDSAIATYPLGEIHRLHENTTGQADPNRRQTSEPITEPQGVFQLADGRLIMSRSCDE